MLLMPDARLADARRILFFWGVGDGRVRFNSLKIRIFILLLYIFKNLRIFFQKLSYYATENLFFLSLTHFKI